ncbi:MAG: AraC family transcriptional regulator [Oscillospiraceae bacterium]|nr:AraC family transcriptional regulator [Oscillospiraceae bacterium]
MFPKEKIDLGQNVMPVVENDRCSVYKIQGPIGDGLMTCYELLPGIVLMHCDMHMPQYFSELRAKAEMFSIDHCREGRMESRLTSGQIIYLDAGTAVVHTADGILPEFSCPTSHYHGLTIAFFLDEAQASLASLFAGGDIDLRRLRDKFCGGKPPIILPKEKVPCSLFSALYEAPQNDDRRLHLLKLLELLFYLSDLDISGLNEKPYFYKTQVEKVKAIERNMMENLGAAHTIQSLSARFDFPPTSLKLCFKGVFGSSIHAYLRNQRMSVAAKLLRETNDRVADIAASVGYENASKFAEAFRVCMGKSPNEYRRQTPPPWRYGDTKNIEESTPNG